MALGQWRRRYEQEHGDPARTELYRLAVGNQVSEVALHLWKDCEDQIIMSHPIGLMVMVMVDNFAKAYTGILHSPLSFLKWTDKNTLI